ncbi:sugar phosphate isomerase/epimerase [Clostridium sp. AM58-1XD]|uniref:sugar phosphate isomerase/epimerase family protein n=1 Tax=Clostridium sp. AM58-1XD TaxID=2292307 RepID=UPI000E475F34|nr:sugar phosphate isomerase/epimerase [Clostridium sp. AM58-1XD]RGZ00352.1 sugar phosphate isomerase/epimerase [Clostridium sp. AM58-1XD]
MKFGYCTSFDNYPLLDQLGYDYIELAGREVVGLEKSKLNEMEKTLKTGRVKCCGFNSAVPGEIAIVGENYSEETAREYAKKLCAVGGQLGISGIGIGSPASRRLPYGYNVPLADSQAEEFLSIFGEESAPYGIKIFWEHLNPTEGNYGLTWNHGVELVKKVNMENVMMVCDLYHMEVNREFLLDLDQEPSLIGHVHMAQLEGTERRGILPNYRARYEEFIEKLKSLGYDGIISIEAFSGSVDEEAAGSIRLLRELCGMQKA